MTTVIHGVPDLRERVGTHVGASGWVSIDQRAIDTFGDVTYDHNWVHCDPERAATTPFGSTIAHGYHTLALVGGLIQDVIDVRDTSLALNYGLAKARFPAAVPVGAKLRLDVTLLEAKDAGPALDVTWRCAVEIEGCAKPACVADAIFRYFPAAD